MPMAAEYASISATDAYLRRPGRLSAFEPLMAFAFVLFRAFHAILIEGWPFIGVSNL